MTETLTLAVCVSVTWIVLGCIIPWMTRLAVLYRLHDLRDDICDAAELLPAARQTKAYRIAELIVTMALHTVRGGSRKDLIAFSAAILHRDRVGSGAIVKAMQSDSEEIFADEVGSLVLARLLMVPDSTGWLLVLLFVLGSPMGMLVSVAATFYSLVSTLVGLMLLGRKSATKKSGVKLDIGNAPRGPIEALRTLSKVLPPHGRDVSRALGLSV